MGLILDHLERISTLIILKPEISLDTIVSILINGLIVT